MTLFQDAIANYWTGPVLAINFKILFDLVGALILGAAVGYERFYHGHAAGMRTYGVVCMASAALVSILGHPAGWYGGHVAISIGADPTRVIQGIVTGIGFLGAGVIVHEQFSTHGLTTAASIWASSAIGILVGIELYPAAIFLTALSAACMTLVNQLENRLPSREGIAVVLEFAANTSIDAGTLRQRASEKGYEIGRRSLSIVERGDRVEWHFIAIARDRTVAEPVAELSHTLRGIEGVVGFQLAHARN